MKRPLLILSFAVAAALGVSACGGGKSKSPGAEATSAVSMQPGMPAASGGAIPDCGSVQAVWVNLKTRVYHEPGDPRYGKTKHGEYLCPAQAQEQGFHAAGAGRERHRHRKSEAPATQ